MWSDAIEYYLTEYGLAPDEAFCAHIVACDCQCPTASAGAVSQGVRLLAGEVR